MDKKKVLALGLSLMSLITAATVTSTVAWYRGSSYLNVSNINISFKDPELSISVNGDNYVRTITDENEGENKLNEVKAFKAVSSMFSDSWISQRKETPVFKNSFRPGNQYVFNQADDVKDATEGYFSQLFYVKSTREAYITVDTALSSVKADTKANEEQLNDERFMNKMKAKFPSLEGDALRERVLDNLNNVVNSLRLSILTLDDDANDEYDDYAYYIIDPKKDKETYMGGILDTTGMGLFDTYNHKEILYGEVSSNKEDKTVEQCIVYNNPLAEDIVVNKEDATCFHSGNLTGDQKIDLEQSKANGLEIKKENSISFDEVEEKVLIPVATNRPTRLVLSFYQEGWDLENTDFIRYSHFKVNVLFKIAPVMPRF